MTVTDRHVTALRALLADDAGTFEQLLAEDGDEQAAPLAVLLTTAFFAAVRMRFTSSQSETDIIRYVARLRAADDGNLSDLSPALAEALLLSAVNGRPLLGSFPEAAKAYAQAAMLSDLTSSLSEPQIDQLLDSARQQADRWVLET